MGGGFEDRKAMRELKKMKEGSEGMICKPSYGSFSVQKLMTENFQHSYTHCHRAAQSHKAFSLLVKVLSRS